MTANGKLWDLIRFLERRYGYSQAEAIAVLQAELRSIKQGASSATS